MKITNTWLTHHNELVGIFSIINKLCRLCGVKIHHDDEKINPILTINQSVVRRIPTYHIHKGEQEEAENE